ncbi:hypothetical protein [Sutcliffiella horikoshii]|uniref:hypothetical protein n=1 Tax=Sutcliffiella horikoshii TaxID=79883 RepID=UPI001F2C9B83|nr:hypothetical protein [Sutcliffiella horikoshii]MCG1021413.1 hypothetical protein [Sutcliffiella horikoshii]
MLAVAEINYYIREEINNKDCLYTDVARRMNRDVRTIKKYADMEDFNEQPKRKQTRKSPVLGPVKEIIDLWKKEDLKQKKKFRRTAKRMWELLKEHHDFAGSDRTIREYVSMKKKSSLKKGSRGQVP